MTLSPSGRWLNSRQPLPGQFGDRNWVAYVGPFTFPWGQAASRRVLGVASSIAATGRRVLVLSGEPAGEPPRAVNDDRTIWTVGTGELPVPRASTVSKLARMTFTWGRSAIATLTELGRRPSHLIVYGGHSAWAVNSLVWCRRNGVSLIHDAVEWYDPKQLSGGRWGPLWMSNELAVRGLHRLGDGVIAISSTLARHYSGQGLTTCVVPPTLDTSAHSWRVEVQPGEVSLGYFGTPGPKDLIAPVIEAVHQLISRGAKVRLTIAGPSCDQVRGYWPGPLPKSTHIPGRCPQQQVMEMISMCDATFLVRPRERFTMAGFPTKFVESLATGTPVIGTITSDLDRYLIDGRTGFVVDGTSMTVVKNGIERILGTPSGQLTEMRQAARETAVQYFDYRRHVSVLDEFLSKVAK